MDSSTTFIKNPMMFFNYWTTMRNSSDFLTLLDDHPNMGILLCDGRDRPTLVHGISSVPTTQSFYGFMGNNTNIAPIEFELGKKTFFLKSLPPTLHPDTDQTLPDTSSLLDESLDFDADDTTVIPRRGRPPKDQSGTPRICSFFLIHPYLLPTLLELPQPLRSIDPQGSTVWLPPSHPTTFFLRNNYKRSNPQSYPPCQPQLRP
jgi:hypothetical protein